MNQYRVFLIISFSLVLLLDVASSEISFGSLQLEKRFLMEKEKIIETQILFWNSGSSPLYLELIVLKSPKNIKVLVEKDNILLQPENVFDKNEKILIDGMEVNALPIKIKFYILDNKTEGEVIIKALARKKHTLNEEIQIVQERLFTFSFENKEIEKLENFEEKNKRYTQNKTDKLYEKIETISEDWKILVVLLFLLFLILFFFRFKKTKKKREKFKIWNNIKNLSKI